MQVVSSTTIRGKHEDYFSQPGRCGPVGVRGWAPSLSVPALRRGCFVRCSYGWGVCRGVVPFIMVQFLTLTIVVLFPTLATWLPQRIVGF